MPKVSILVPIYNVEKYLRECLDSCINQTLQDIEIICLNDGSTDSSLEIIKEYAAKDSRVVIVDKPNSGYGNNMNVGLDKASGEYIGIVESDDLADPNMFEVLYNKAKELDLDFIKSDYRRFIGKEKSYEEFYTPLYKTNEFYNRIINPQEEKDVFSLIMNNWSGIYKREFLNKYNIRHHETPGAAFQDTGFWFKVFTLARRVMFLRLPFYMYRVDNVNASRHNSKKVFVIFDEYKYIYDFLKENDLFNEYKYVFNYQKFKTYMNAYIKLTINLRWEFLTKMQKELNNAFNNEEIDQNLFSKKEHKDLMLMIKHPIIFYIQRELMFAIWNAINLEIYGKDNVRMKLFGIKIRIR